MAHEEQTQYSAIKAPPGSYGIVTGHKQVSNIISSVLQQASSSNGLGQEELLAKLTTVQETLSVMDSHLHTLVPPEVFQHYCPPHATGTAQKVFDIPELLEMILSNLQVHDLTRVPLVNRQFKATIDSSAQLQKLCTLLPPLVGDLDDMDFCLLSERTRPGIEFDVGDTWSSLSYEERKSLPLPYQPEQDTWEARSAVEKQSILISVRFTKGRISLGPKVRRMPIAQTTVPEVNVSIDCCDAHLRSSNRRWGYTWRDFRSNLSAPGGLTLGDLADEAARLKKQHCECPYASASLHNEATGGVQPSVTFRAYILLPPEHLTIRMRQTLDERAQASRLDREKKYGHIEYFMAAKRRGEYKLSHSEELSANARVAREIGTPAPDFAECCEMYFKQSESGTGSHC